MGGLAMFWREAGQGQLMVTGVCAGSDTPAPRGAPDESPGAPGEGSRRWAGRREER